MIKLFDYGSRIFTYRELQVNCVISWKCSIKIILTKISECDWVAVDWRTLMSLIYASQLGLSSSVFLRWEFLKENKKTRFRPRKRPRQKKKSIFLLPLEYDDMVFKCFFLIDKHVMPKIKWFFSNWPGAWCVWDGLQRQGQGNIF